MSDGRRELAFVEEPIRLFRPRLSETALPDYIARRLGAASIGLLVAGSIVLYLFSPREGVVTLNFGAKPSHDDNMTPPVSETSGRTPPSTKIHIQARLFPPMGSPQIFSGLKTKGVNLCQSLADAGFDTTPWQKTLVDDVEWECTSTLTPVAEQPSAEAPQSSVFFAFRGSPDGKITNLRMKLNLLNPLQDNHVVDQALRFLAVLQNFADLSLPKEVVDAVARRKPLLMKTYSATYRWGPEISDERRLNLMISYLDWPPIVDPGEEPTLTH